MLQHASVVLDWINKNKIGKTCTMQELNAENNKTNGFWLIKGHNFI